MCGDGEYIIYTVRIINLLLAFQKVKSSQRVRQALAWRNKSFGTAIEVVWANNGDYATRDAPARIKLFHDFKERHTISLGYTADAIFGGAMLGVRSGQDFVFFYDWESGAR